MNHDGMQETNVHYRDSLTVWGETASAQIRDGGALAVHHYDGAPRSSENGHPYMLPAADAVWLRDLLNAATDRGFLPAVVVGVESAEEKPQRPDYAPFAPADPAVCTCVDPFAACPTHD